MSNTYTGELHFVFGGELSSLEGLSFKDLTNLDFVGAFADKDAAVSAWRSKAQQTVDNAHMRYFVVNIADLIT